MRKKESPEKKSPSEKINAFQRIHFNEIGSTQDYLRDNAGDLVTKSKWVVVTANFQTKGRGTQNRKWVSPPDVNIYATFAIDLEPLIANKEDPEENLKELFNHPIIVQSASLAAAKTLEYFGFKPTIKWRNDLLLDRKKVCGILCELVTTPSGRRIGLIGIGLNVNMSKEICDGLDQSVTSMAVEGKREYDKEQVFEILCGQLSQYIQLYAENGFKVFHNEVVEKMEFVNEIIRVQDADSNSVYEGLFKGIDNTGQLLLDLQDGTSKTIRFGSILKENFNEKNNSSIDIKNQKNEETESTAFLEKTLLSIKFAALRSAGIIIEYPFESIKTRWQGNIAIKTLPKVLQYSYQRYGLLGFYNGFIPNTVKKIPVQMYRWPFILQLPEHYSNLLNNFKLFKDENSSNSSNYSKLALANFMSGLTIATIETPLVAPIETCKLDLIVNRDQTKSILDFFKLNPSLKLQFLGIGAFYLKEVSGWTSFLVSLNVLRNKIKDYNGDNTIKPYQIIPLSLTVGMANAIAITPWDVARSQIQKYKYMEDKTLRNIMNMIIKQHGIGGLYTGWAIRAIQMTVATALSIPVIEKFEKIQMKNGKSKLSV